MYESPVSKNRSVTLSLSWTGTCSRKVVAIFTIFGKTKLISSSKCAVAIRVIFLWCPVNSWHFKFANKLAPLYTDLFLYKSFCSQRLSLLFFLLDNVRYTNMKATLGTCKNDILPPGTAKTGGWLRAAHSPECAPSSPKLNLGASRTPWDYVTLLRCGRML